jgi:aspartate-semialdehyde dehydrogenase
MGPGMVPLWSSLQRQLRVQIYGAGEALGKELAVELLSAGHPIQGLRLFGRQARIMGWKEQRLEVHGIVENLPEADIAFLCMPREFTQPLMDQLGRTSTRVVDLSGYGKSDASTPFFTGQAKRDQVGAFTPMVTLPTRSAVGLARALTCLERSAGLTELSVVGMIAAASEGSRGILDLRDEYAAFDGSEKIAPEDRRLGNLRPALGEQIGDPGGWLEQEIRSDVLRILGRPELPFELSALEGGAERCDAFVVRARLRAPLGLDALGEAFGHAEGMVLHAGLQGPLPQSLSGDGRVHVGRLRHGAGGEGTLSFLVVADQLRVGGAGIALQAAQQILAS